MFVTKLKILAAVLLFAFAVAVTIGAGFAAAGLRDGPVAANAQTPTPKQPEAPKPEKELANKADEAKDDEPSLLKMQPLAADPKDDELQKLMKERFNAALTELQLSYETVLAGKNSMESLFDATSRLKLAGLELYDDPKEKRALLEQVLELAKEAERITQVRFEAGQASAMDVQRLHFYRTDVQIALLRLKGKSGEKPK